MLCLPFLKASRDDSKKHKTYIRRWDENVSSFKKKNKKNTNNHLFYPAITPKTAPDAPSAGFGELIAERRLPVAPATK